MRRSHIPNHTHANFTRQISYTLSVCPHNFVQTDMMLGEVICSGCGIIVMDRLENSDNVILWRLGLKDQD